MLVAPGAAIVVELEVAAADIANDWVAPTRQLNSQSFGRLAEELDRPPDWRCQTKPQAGSSDRCWIADLGLNRDDMGHRPSFPLESKPLLGISENWLAWAFASRAEPSATAHTRRVRIITGCFRKIRQEWPRLRRHSAGWQADDQPFAQFV